jgi:ligand-binding sensor domain-containing protein
LGLTFVTKTGIQTRSILAWFLFLAGALLPSASQGQAPDTTPPPPLTQYSLDTWVGADGLPQIRIRAIQQTRDGYLWLGTANGLLRFDGVNFTTFGLSTGSLKDNEIGCLAQDREGSLWIGTYGGGLTRLKEGRFTTFTTADGLPDNYIRKVDADPQGNLWCATPSGVGRFSQGRFTTFTTRDGLPNNFISGLCASSPQGIFVVSGGRLQRFVNGRFVAETAVMDDRDGRMDSMTSGADGALWMTFETSKIKRWQDGKLTTYTQADQKIDRPGAIYEDPQGSLWIATRHGLLRFRNGTIEALTTPEPQAKLGVVQSFFADREGNLWLGTEANGLARLRSVSVHTLTADDGLSDSSTRCVYKDRQGNIWVGAYQGLTRLSHGQATLFSQSDGNPLATVTSIGEDLRGQLWIASGGKLLVMNHDQLSPVAGWTNVFDIKVIACDQHGDMWMGTDGEGLFQYSAGKLKSYQSSDGLANNQVRAILSGRAGELWVGTSAGLSRFQDGRFTNFGLADGLANTRVMSLCEDADGTLWVGTRGGLSRYRDGHFHNFRETDGLPNNYVFNVLDDGGGNFWLSTGSGIGRVRKTDLNAVADGQKPSVEVASLGYRDGLRSTSLAAGTHPIACADDSGQLLFCSLKGLVVVTPDRQTMNREIPPVRIEQVQINHHDQPVDQPPALAPGSGELEIHYTALSYVAPEKVRFKYRLEGIDSGWVEAGQRRFAVYAHLPPGDYRFQVIACNNDGVWNKAGAMYAFRLPPRFYQTAWFYASALLMLAGLAGGAYALKLRRLHARERELQRRVNEAVARVKVLQGLLPICTSCKKIRDDHGYWNQIESYMSRNADIQFSHSLCPDCLKTIYPDLADDVIEDLKELQKKTPPTP